MTMRLSVVLTAVTLTVSTISVGGSAYGEPAGSGDGQRFERITDLPDRPATLPTGLDARREATVVLELAGRPVGLLQADAQARGNPLSRAERAAKRSALASRQKALHDDIAAAGGHVLGQWQDAYNGIKVRIAGARVAGLAALPGVVGIHGLERIEPDNERGVPFIGTPAAWSDLGVTGAGMKIAVIDSGIDYYHADFGGSGNPADFANDDGTVVEPGTFPTAKVVGGHDFVGDDYDAGSSDPARRIAHPDPDPKDCGGHGTHVAGTAAGFGVLPVGTTYAGPYDESTYDNDFLVGPGVAPEAQLYAYRVFGCDGSTQFVIDALNRAVVDDVDVVNMSLGSSFGRADSPTAVASDVASAAGIVVVTSAGNSGPNAYLTGAPGTAETAISVAAVDAVPGFPAATVQLPSGTVTVLNSNAADLSTPVTGPLRVLQSAPGVISLGCDDADYAAVQPGDIVVTLRGVCARIDRVIKGQAAGAAAVIMINNAPGLPPFEGQIPGVTIPFLGAAGGTDATFLAADGATVTVSDGGAVPNPTFRRLADFTSGGPRSGDSGLKPDVTAPGVSIVSAEVGGGTSGIGASGTSMAAPHTAGVAALTRAANPTWTPAQVKAAIVNTAEASLIANYNPRLGGSGVVQPRRAADSVARATSVATGQPNLSYGYEPMAGAFAETQSLRLTNDSGAAVEYHLSAAFSGSALGTTATVSPATVTVPAGGSADVDVTLSLSAAAVAALPHAEQAAGALVTARGAVTATPTTAATGVYDLRVPFLLVPRGLSDVRAGTAGPYTQKEGIARKTVPLSNPGVHRGNADVYAWGLSDPADTGGEMDVRTAGVQALPGDVVGAPGDTLLVFAVNTYGRWSNASGLNEIDIAIDLQHDGKVDYYVIGFDLGRILTGAFDGRYGSFVFDADLNLLDVFVADAPMNGSTVLLPALASNFALPDDRGHFTYTAAGFDFSDGLLVDVVNGAGQFNTFLPAVSTGDFITLAPGGTANLTVSVDRGKFAGSPTLGWLVVTMDDANGAPQAAQVPVGKLPPMKP